MAHFWLYSGETGLEGTGAERNKNEELHSTESTDKDKKKESPRKVDYKLVASLVRMMGWTYLPISNIEMKSLRASQQALSIRLNHTIIKAIVPHKTYFVNIHCMVFAMLW
jgi:hypothetical protein